jgi:hypothetical protein
MLQPGNSSHLEMWGLAHLPDIHHRVGLEQRLCIALSLADAWRPHVSELDANRQLAGSLLETCLVHAVRACTSCHAVCSTGHSSKHLSSLPMLCTAINVRPGVKLLSTNVLLRFDVCTSSLGVKLGGSIRAEASIYA